MRTCAAICAVLAAAGVGAARAQADVGIRITTEETRVGGLIRGWANGSAASLYLVPESAARRPYPCRGGFCTPRVRRVPQPPYVFLGRLRRTRSHFVRQRFAFRVPRVRPGRYQVAMWCRPCGGSLILAGATMHGQVVVIRR